MTAINSGGHATSGDLLIAFHCSASAGAQWRGLCKRLGPQFTGKTPDMGGSPQADHWSGNRPFLIAHELAPSLEAVDCHDGPVHIVGHSYGGAVALHLACARPERVASLTLYEPSAFYLLTDMGEAARTAHEQISAVAARLRQALIEEDPHAAAHGFVDYWSGRGAFGAMRPEAQAAIAASMPKVDLEFQAVFAETLKAADFANFPFPVLIIRGDASPEPTLRIADYLAATIAGSAMQVIAGMGHMAPLTHPDIIAGTMASHIEDTATVRH